MRTNMYPSSLLLAQDTDKSVGSLPINDLIEKADGFAGTFSGVCVISTTCNYDFFFFFL